MVVSGTKAGRARHPPPHAVIQACYEHGIHDLLKPKLPFVFLPSVARRDVLVVSLLGDLPAPSHGI